MYDIDIFTKTEKVRFLLYGPELVHYMVNEIKTFINRKIQKIDACNNNVIFSFSNRDCLLLSWDSKSCGLAKINEDNKKALISMSDSTPAIINTLKSNLLNAVITDIRQLNRDKIVCIEFKKTIGLGFFNNRKIIIELSDRYSNLLLLDEDNIIIETCKHIYPEANQYRTILPGVEYKFPPELNGISIEDWLAAPSVSTLSEIIGIGRKLSRYLSDLHLNNIINIIRHYYNADISAYKILKIKNYVTLIPSLACELHVTPASKSIFKEITYTEITDDKLNKTKNTALKVIRKDIIRRERQINDIKKLLNTENDTKFKVYGDAIFANLWMIKQGSREECLSYYSEEGEVLQVSVPLNPEITPSQNAENYYRKYKKIINAQKNASVILDKVREELDFLYEEETLIQCADSDETINDILAEAGLESKVTNKLKKKKNDTSKAELPYRRVDFEDSIIFFGLSAKGNRFVTFKIASSDDLWFHAQGIPGTHVILRITCDIEEDRLEYLKKFCSSIAVNYSKSIDGNVIRVDYTNKKFISPIKGEIAGVTYKNFKTIFTDNKLYQEFLSGTR